MSDRVDVRKRRADEALPAPAASAAADDDEPAKPKKKDFRTRAHSNVLNANDFWFPASPAEVPLAQYFPERAAGARVEFLDVGCGYGSLLLELAAIFPRALMLGGERVGSDGTPHEIDIGPARGSDGVERLVPRAIWDMIFCFLIFEEGYRDARPAKRRRTS